MYNTKEEVFAALNDVKFTKKNFGKWYTDVNLLKELVKDELRFFKKINPSIRKNKGFVLSLINEGIWLTRLLDKSLMADKDIALALINVEDTPLLRAGSSTLYYLSEELKDDKEVVIKNVQKDGISLVFASERLKNDRDVVAEAIKENPESIKYGGPDIINNKEIFLEILKKDGWLIRYASPDLKNDKEVILAALKKSEFALDHASSEIRDLCGNQDPIDVLTSVLEFDKMKKEITTKTSLKYKKTKI